MSTADQKIYIMFMYQLGVSQIMLSCSNLKVFFEMEWHNLLIIGIGKLSVSTKTKAMIFIRTTMYG